MDKLERDIHQGEVFKGIENEDLERYVKPAFLDLQKKLDYSYKQWSNSQRSKWVYIEQPETQEEVEAIYEEISGAIWALYNVYKKEINRILSEEEKADSEFDKMEESGLIFKKSRATEGAKYIENLERDTDPLIDYLNERLEMNVPKERGAIQKFTDWVLR